ncbi:hypothetical protein C8R44DRAFT_974048 [Mycena epipterygia]|nr:hypothetical protein C8R44DRAFT_974048 [Mycena epipterygia]
MFTSPYIRANPHLFLDTAWINIPALRAFLEARDRGASGRDAIVISSSSPAPSGSPAPLIRVKSEFGASGASNASLIPPTMKLEAVSVMPAIRTRAFTEGNREVIELLSDSYEDDIGPDIPGLGTQTNTSDAPSSSPQINALHILAPETPISAGGAPSSSPGMDLDDFEDLDAVSLQNSDTIWIDTHISSMVRKISMDFTSDSRTYVEVMEYVLPVPRVPTAYIFNFSDPNFNHTDKDGNLISVDALIKRQDNDLWHGNSGRGDTTVDVIFVPGETPIHCRRSRMDCNGCHACSAVNPALLNVTRHELDITSRDAVFAAQRDTRRKEGETPEQRATAFFDRVKSIPCTAKHGDGSACSGKPKLMKKKDGKSRGHNYWIACNGWTPNFQESHRTHAIPDNVNEDILVKLFDKKRLANDDSLDTTPCSRIVHPHVGGKLKFCRHPHIIKGEAISQCPIEHHKCPSKRSYYIPVDPTMRKVLVFHPKCVPHNHPIPPLLKLSHESEAKYDKSVEAVGLLGSTVSTVDHAPSTKMIFEGQMPGQFAPALLGKRIKRDIIREKKKKAYPAGLGVTGAYELYREDLNKPPEERYIHRFHHTGDDGLIIFTCFTALLGLLDDDGVKAFEDASTFKRIAGELNEWEVVIFLQCSRASYYPCTGIKIEATGWDIGFARFMPNGNLLVMNADMEAAQALGAARSFMKTNIPSFSEITTLDPHVFATFFIKFCSSHAKRPLQDFKSLVSADDFKRLKEFMYIDSVKMLNSFSKFINGLGVKKIQDWWAHKKMNDWVIPCLVKSQSNILPVHWDTTPATTNTGEAQHHWTNSVIGIKKTIVEGIESARDLDWNVVCEV